MKREAYHPCLQANRDDKILFYPTKEKPKANYPPPLARSPSLFRQSQNRDDKILFYPTEEKPKENYPPPLARSPSLFRQSRDRDDKASLYLDYTYLSNTN